jgi:hypothetical protein
MKKELRTMEEKMKLNPDEIMENGLTRAQNEQIEKDAENFRGIMALICGGIAVYCVIQSLGALSGM